MDNKKRRRNRNSKTVRKKKNVSEQRKDSVSIHDMLFNYDKIAKEFQCSKCEFSCLSRQMYADHCCDKSQELSIINDNTKDHQVQEKEKNDKIDSNISIVFNDTGAEKDVNIDENINDEENSNEKDKVELTKVASSAKVILFDVSKFPPIGRCKQKEVKRNSERLTSEVNSAIKSNDIGTEKKRSLDKKIDGEEINCEKRTVEEMKVESLMNKSGIYGKSTKNYSFTESNNGFKSNGIDTVENMSRNEKINYEELNYERNNLKEIKDEAPDKIILLTSKYMHQKEEVKIYENSTVKEIAKGTDILKKQGLTKNSKVAFEYPKINNSRYNHSVEQKSNPQQKMNVNGPIKSFIRNVAGKKTCRINNNIVCKSVNLKKSKAVSSKEILTRSKLKSSFIDHDYTDSIKLSSKASSTVAVRSRASQEIKKIKTLGNKEESKRIKDSVTQKTEEVNRNINVSFADPLIETPVSASIFHLQKNKDDYDKEKIAFSNSERSEKAPVELVLYESIHNDISDDDDHIIYECYPRYEEVLNERKTLINHNKSSASLSDILLNYHKISKDFMCAQCHFSCLTRTVYDDHSCEEYMKSGRGKVKKENLS